ncbi:3-dehydroquinate synthase [Erythrobacteraceae bacterium CFH 75059]|uniref:3-dehydroquinate synthase n=1 Tax=Qipengyuania thermophila TaxID=2509361 RepID=UPI00102101CF|nr:3-dehydroquinate synthase [Qipengyuania thermophila]TCD05552.1 3-dehydroquinate synthase [Erythrobacteraceae bacterium CFH 75059]
MVPHRDGCYDVLVGAGLLTGDHLPEPLAGLLREGRTVPVVTDAHVFALHGASLERLLTGAGHSVAWHILPPRERSKSWPHLEGLVEWMLELGLTRTDAVLAFGGGVVGDLAGFAAAIMKRGCGVIQIPTTLLAQVDSSVGGKTAINARAGKNLVGAFHQPALVLADTALLATLPDREMRAGLAEVIKCALLADAGLFRWLEKNAAAIMAREAEPLSHAIAASIGIKAEIVAADERETADLRALLNLGHTFGHALEAETGFSDRLLHGEAVAVGLVLAARYSVRRGTLAPGAASRVESAVAAAQLPASLRQAGLTCTGDTLVAHMKHDKKMDGAALPFILLEDIGRACVVRDVALEDVACFLDEERGR